MRTSNYLQRKIIRVVPYIHLYRNSYIQSADCARRSNQPQLVSLNWFVSVSFVNKALKASFVFRNEIWIREEEENLSATHFQKRNIFVTAKKKVIKKIYWSKVIKYTQLVTCLFSFKTETKEEKNCQWCCNIVSLKIFKRVSFSIFYEKETE